MWGCLLHTQSVYLSLGKQLLQSIRCVFWQPSSILVKFLIPPKHPGLYNNAVINAIDSPQVHCVLKIRRVASTLCLFLSLSAITIPQLHSTFGRLVVTFSGQTGSSLHVWGCKATCILCCPNRLSDTATFICSCCLYWALCPGRKHTESE